MTLGSLLLISASSIGGQKVQSPEPEKSKPPVKTEQRGRILGIGGVFFKSANRDQTREWYSKHLGLSDKGQGAMLPWREHDDPQKEHVTVWTVFSASSHYFDPSPAPFMFNYIVDDMDALLDRLKEEGVKIDPKRMMNPTVALPGSMTWMGIRLSSGSRPQSPKGLPLHLLNRFLSLRSRSRTMAPRRRGLRYLHIGEGCVTICRRKKLKTCGLRFY